MVEGKSKKVICDYGNFRVTKRYVFVMFKFVEGKGLSAYLVQSDKEHGKYTKCKEVKLCQKKKKRLKK